MKYDVFISYSRLDYKDEKGNIIPDNVVSKVKDALASAGVTYWFDEDGIHHGDDFAEKIVANIEESDIFIYLSTENANKSSWTRKEIACAYELEKKIIPVRVDNSRYDRSVMLRISDLDYIDYMKNPEKGMQELLKEVAYYIKNKRDEENKREEEIERKRILEEKEIEEIELLIKKLQAEELSVEVARDDLLLRIQRINNDEKRNHLQSLVESTSPGIIKNREKDNSISELKKENQKLKDKLLRIQRINNDEKRNHLQSLVESTSPGIIKNREKDNSISELKKENQKLKDKLDNMPDVGIMPDKLKKRYIAIVIVLSVLLLSSVVGLIFTSKSISEKESAILDREQQIEDLKNKVEVLNDKIMNCYRSRYDGLTVRPITE